MKSQNLKDKKEGIEGVEEVREAYKPVGTIYEVIKAIIKKDYAGAFESALPIIKEVNDARDGLDIAWKREIPDIDFTEASVIGADFTEIASNENYGKIAGGLSLILSGITSENKRLKDENAILKSQVSILRSQKKG